MNWKGWTLDALVNWAAPTVATLALFVPRFGARGDHGLRPRVAWSVYALTRPAYVVLLYFFAGYAGSGDFAFWTRAARDVLGGGRVGATIESGYGPLFTYLQTAGYVLVAHPVGTLLPFLVGDFLCVRYGPLLARAFDARSEHVVRLWALASPLLWHQLVVRGQDETLMLGLVVTACVHATRGRLFGAGLALGLGMVATKPTIAPMAFAACLAFTRDRSTLLRTLAGAGVVTATGYAIYFAAGGTLVGMVPPVPPEFCGFSPGGLLLRPLGDAGFRLGTIAFVAGACALGACMAWRTRGRDVAWRAVVVLASVHAVGMLLVPKYHGTYEAQGVLFLVPLLFAARTRSGGAGLVGLAALAWVASVGAYGTTPFVAATSALSAAVNGLVLVTTWRLTRQPATTC